MDSNKTPQKPPPTTPNKRPISSPSSVTPNKRPRGHCMDIHQINWSAANRRYSQVTHIRADHEGRKLDLYRVPLDEPNTVLANRIRDLNRQVLGYQQTIQRAGTHEILITMAILRLDQQKDKEAIAALKSTVAEQDNRIKIMQRLSHLTPTESEDQQKEIKTLNSDMADLKSAMADLTSKFEAMKTKAEEQETEIKTQRAEIKTLTTKSEDPQTEIKTLTSTVAC